jgi:hypothetical protein
MKYVLLAFVAATLAMPVHAATWRLAVEISDQPAVLMFIDSDTVVPAGNFYEFELLYFVEGETVETDRTGAQRQQISCNPATIRLLSDRNWIGEVEQPQSQIDPASAAPAKGSVAEALINVICDKQSYLTGAVADPYRYADDYFSALADADM